MIIWIGNELVGRRGVFVDPDVPKWRQTAENMEATGVWEEVTSKVCGQIQRLAALKGRPCVNSVQLLGDAYPADYKLPPEYRVRAGTRAGNRESRCGRLEYSKI